MPAKLSEDERIKRKFFKKLGISPDGKRYKGYGIDTQLTDVFNKYRNKEDWKFPFEAVVKSRKEKDILMHAIVFFLADKPYVRRIGKSMWHVKTKGYQAW